MLTLTGRGNVQHALSVFGNTSANQQNHAEFILISWPKHIFYLKCLLPSWQYYKGHMVFVQKYWWLKQNIQPHLQRCRQQPLAPDVTLRVLQLPPRDSLPQGRCPSAGYRLQSGIHIAIDRMPSCVWKKHFTYECMSDIESGAPLKGLFSWVQKPHTKE